MLSPEELGSVIHLSRLLAEYIRMTRDDGGIGGVCFLFVEGDKKAKLNKGMGIMLKKSYEGTV